MIPCAVSVQPVETTREIEKFISFSQSAYRGNSLWAPPILSDTRKFLNGKGLFFEHCRYRLWIAKENGRAVAALAAFCDGDYQKHWNEKAGFIGFFEAQPGKVEYVRALFEAAEDYLRELGVQTVFGPFNGSVSHPVGLLGNAYELAPVFLMPYTPDYYHEYFLGQGYQKAKELTAFTMDLTGPDCRREIDYFLNHPQEKEIVIRPFNKKCFRKEVFLLARIYSETFKKHWGYAPQKEEEFLEIIKPFEPVLDPDFILFAEHRNKTIGFTICTPDYNPAIRKLKGDVDFLGGIPFLFQLKNLREARLIAIGVTEEWRGRDIAPFLTATAFRSMIRKGYTVCEYSWVLEENTASRNVAAKFHGVPYKQYYVYSKTLTN